MPTPKLRLDADASYRHKKFRFTPYQWYTMENNVQNQLRPFYPDKQAKACPFLWDQADDWASHLLHTAYEAIDSELWYRQRLTNEQLRVEIKFFLSILEKKGKCHIPLSHDLIPLIGDCDLDYYNIDHTFIPHLQNALSKIGKLPRATKEQDARYEAAVEMTIRVLHILKDWGIPLAATADPDSGYYSDAVKILKIIGDQLTFELKGTTWKDYIIEAKKRTPGLRVC